MPLLLIELDRDGLSLDRDGIRGKGDGPKGPRTRRVPVSLERRTEEAIKTLIRELDEVLKALYRTRDDAKSGIKRVKAGGEGSLSRLRKQRADTNKLIEVQEKKLRELQEELRRTREGLEPAAPIPEPTPETPTTPAAPELPPVGTPHARPTFTNVGEAEAHLRENYNIVPRPGINPDTLQEEPPRLVLKYSQMASNEMANITDKFDLVDRFARGEEVGQPTYQYRMTRGDLLVSGEGLGDRNVMGRYFPTRSSIAAGNTIELFASKVRVASVEYPPQLGEFNVGTTAQYVFRHEYGHRVWYQGLTMAQRIDFTRKGNPYVREVSGSYAPRPRRRAGSTIPRPRRRRAGTGGVDAPGSKLIPGRRHPVSEYSGTNIGELWAESFAAITSPKYVEGSLPQEIESTMYRILGKRQGLSLDRDGIRGKGDGPTGPRSGDGGIQAVESRKRFGVEEIEVAGKNVLVHYNLKRKDAVALLDKYPDGIRGVCDPITGDLAFWDANKVLHFQMTRALGFHIEEIEQINDELLEDASQGFEGWDPEETTERTFTLNLESGAIEGKGAENIRGWYMFLEDLEADGSIQLSHERMLMLVLDRDGIRGKGDGPKGPRTRQAAVAAEAPPGREKSEIRAELAALDEKLKALFKRRDETKVRIKAIKASGDKAGLSKARKLRATTNKEIVALELRIKTLQDELEGRAPAGIDRLKARLREAMAKIRVDKSLKHPGRYGADLTALPKNVWMGTESTYDEGDLEYLFKTRSGRTFQIHASTEDEPGDFEISFGDETNRMDATGRGDAFDVFNNVVPAVAKFVETEKPTTLRFSASGESRISLYDRLIRTTIAVSPGYTAFRSNFDARHRYYTIVKDSHARRFLNTEGGGLVKLAEEDEEESFDEPRWVPLEEGIDPAWFEEDAWWMFDVPEEEQDVD